MPDIEFWIQLENRAWDACPSGVDRMSGMDVQDFVGGKPPEAVALRSPVTGHVRTTQMFKPVRDSNGAVTDALILRRYTPNWAAPDDRKVNPWDLNELDPTDNGTMGTIPGPVIECNVGDRVIVHFRNMDLRATLGNDPLCFNLPFFGEICLPRITMIPLPVLQRTHSLHPHGFVFAPAHDGAYPLSPPDTTDDPLVPGQKLNPLVPASAAAWANVGTTGQFKQGDRVPPGETFTYVWNTFSWPTTAGVWLYHDHSVCDTDNVQLGAIGIIVIHNPAEPGDVIVETTDLPGGSLNGNPRESFCFPFSQIAKVGILPQDLQHLGAVIPLSGRPGTPGMPGMAVARAASEGSAARREGARRSPGGAAEIGARTQPLAERTLSLGELRFELDERFALIHRICFPVYRPPPAKALYLQLYHMFADAGMCVNGRKYLGNTPTVIAGPRTKMRFGVVGMGSEAHTFHIHGHRWVIPGPGGSGPGPLQFGGPMDTPVSQFEDTRVFGPANSFVFTIEEGNGFMRADPFTGPAAGTPGFHSPIGEWHMHCHVLEHMMGGMMGSLLVINGGELAFALPEGKPCPTMPMPAPTPGGGGGTPPGGPQTVTVHVQDFKFTPDPVPIKAGDTVAWVWDAANHSTTSDSLLWDSGVHNAPFTFNHTFPMAGNFPYHCTQHGGPGTGMHGTVTVT